MTGIIARKAITMNNTLDKSFKDLLWGIQLSTRYHQHRCAHFDHWHKIVVFLVIILGSSAVAGSLGSYPFSATICAAVITFLSTIELVFAPTQKSRLHFDLASKFIDLEKNIVRSQAEPTDEKLTSLTEKRLSIEAEEPIPLRPLVWDTCYNEMLQKEGTEEGRVLKFKWYHSLIKNFSNYGSRSVVVDTD